MSDLNGKCDPRFERVYETLANNIRSGKEVGASLYANIDGEDVIDLTRLVDEPDYRDVVATRLAELVGALVIQLRQIIELRASLHAFDARRVVQVEHGIRARPQADALMRGR